MTLVSSRLRPAYWLLLSGTALLSLWRLGRLPLLDVDEPVYGEVGREMAWSHSLSLWLTPHFNGALWFDKPPLFYWLTGLSMRLWGPHEMAARFPSALLAVGLVAATSALGRRAFPGVPSAGIWAGFVLATGVQFFLLARASVTDMTLAFTLTAALLGLHVWLADRKPAAILLTGAAVGLACLVKGPVALVLVGGQLLLFLLITRRMRLLLRLDLWAGLALCFAVALPWYLAMIRLHGALFIQGFLEANNITRFLHPEHTETSSPFWYVPIFVLFFLPWTVAVPGALVAAVQRSRAERAVPDAPRPTLFLGLWCLLVFAFFSLSQTKLVTYIFPLFPAMALLVGRWVAQPQAAGQPEARRVFGVYAALFVALAAALFVVGRQYHAAPVTLGTWLAALCAGALACAYPRLGQARWLAPGLAAAVVLLAAWDSPTWNTRAGELSERVPAQVAAAATPPGAPIYALGLKHTSLVYYSGHRVIYTDDRPFALRDMAAHPGHVYAVKVRDLRDLREKWGLRNYRLVFQSPTTCLISGLTPQVSARPVLPKPQF